MATIAVKDTAVAPYDSSIRQSKKVGETLTTFITSGTSILNQKTGEDYFDFLYDESGNLYGFSLNGTIYYYFRNGQGDIIGIMTSGGVVVVRYAYDAWGKLLSISGSMAISVGEKNPFRYRGYYYDNETGLYYLNSRYYDPVTGRFINADGLVSTGQGLLGYNMYAYCMSKQANRQLTMFYTIVKTGLRYRHI